jgi:hypothetical protein
MFRHTVAISSPRNSGLAFFLPLCLSFRPLLRHLLPLPYFPLFRRVFIHRLVGRSFFSTNACSTWHSPSRLRGFQWPARIFRRAVRCRGLAPSPNVTGGGRRSSRVRARPGARARALLRRARA